MTNKTCVNKFWTTNYCLHTRLRQGDKLINVRKLLSMMYTVSRKRKQTTRKMEYPQIENAPICSYTEANCVHILGAQLRCIRVHLPDHSFQRLLMQQIKTLWLKNQVKICRNQQVSKLPLKCQHYHRLLVSFRDSYKIRLA